MSTTGVFAACDRQASAPPAGNLVPAGPPVFVETSFDELYPIFLTRNSMRPGPKAALWRNYYGRWVRWTGTLVSFTANGITIKQLQRTVTFDVSLWLETSQRKDLRRRFKAGDRITYIGRFDTYDDVFRTLYLVYGQIAHPADSPTDGGR